MVGFGGPQGGDQPSFQVDYLVGQLKSASLTRVLAARYGPEVPRIIMALQAEHNALDGPDPVVKVNDPSVLLTSTADKIVALTSLLRRARASGDVTAFFAVRPALLRLLPHFRAFHDSGRGLVPAGMSQALAAVLDRIEQAAAHVIVQ